MQSDLVLHNGPFECAVCLCTYDNNGVVLRDCLHVFCRYENTISITLLYLYEYTLYPPCLSDHERMHPIRYDNIILFHMFINPSYGVSNG